uniref:LysM peptidoglycan-binding domain-containing protein n=1 Tax=Candidatus Electronema sp. TaxID=2698783 RepID=UPI0040579F32
MSQTRNCPVCGRPGLPPDCGSCPQCDADLTCFQALDSLASPTAATVAAPPKKRRFPWAAAGVLALLALLLLAGLAASMKNRLSELDRQLAELKAAEVRSAAESKPKQEPVRAAAPSPPAEQAAKPPESKIQIDARVRIIDEREAARQAAAVKETKNAAAVPPVKPEQSDAGPKVVLEAIESPDTDEEEPTGAAQPPSPSPAAAEQPSPAADLADLPATPPVLLKPEFRKHRVRPAPSVTAAEDMPQRAAAAEQAAPAAAKPQPGGSVSYLVKDGETVWDIAERFYGDRKYYPVVMEQNPHIFLGFIRKNSTVRLFADRSEAEALYQRRTERRDGLLLWKYEVRPGETWRSIYARFFLSRYSGMIFYGDQDVAPGKTMLIILR